MIRIIHYKWMDETRKALGNGNELDGVRSYSTTHSHLDIVRLVGFHQGGHRFR